MREYKDKELKEMTDEDLLDEYTRVLRIDLAAYALFDITPAGWDAEESVVSKKAENEFGKVRAEVLRRLRRHSTPPAP